MTTPTPMPIPTIPVVLGHAACTGGSLIYRILTSTFGFSSLSEVGVARVSSQQHYSPWDPELQLFARNDISAKEFGDIIFDRILACQKIATKKQQRVLVREHTHSFYFNPTAPEILPTGGSWFTDLYREKFGDLVPGIVSVRDPIDSWLGFRRTFATQLPDQFDEYCRVYNRYLDKIDAQNNERKQFLIFKYEDFLTEPQRHLDMIADHIGQPRKEVDLSSVGKLFGSGNSGRVSNDLQKRDRRPFSHRLYKEAENSREYLQLCKRLDYPLVFEDVSTSDRIRAYAFTCIAKCSWVFKLAESFARRHKQTLLTGKNIQ